MMTSIRTYFIFASILHNYYHTVYACIAITDDQDFRLRTNNVIDNYC